MAEFKVLRAGTIKRIHVDQHVIRANKRTVAGEARRPPITVQTSKGSLKAWEVEIRGDSEVKYSPDKPLKCGAHVWVETYAEVCALPEF